MSASIHAQALLDFIDCSPSAWHAVKSIEAQLADFHFQRLDETQIWALKTSGRYYVVRGDSSIIAFVHGKESAATSGFKLIGERRGGNWNVPSRPRIDTSELVQGQKLLWQFP